MNASDTKRAVRALVLAASMLALAACGGGGGGDPAPAAADARHDREQRHLERRQGHGRASATTRCRRRWRSSIAPATPDAATAADPSYVPGTTYAYTAPAIQVPEQVLITIESPAAVGAPRRRRRAASSRSALPPGYYAAADLPGQPPGARGWQPVQNILVSTGNGVPGSRRRRACQKIYQFGEPGDSSRRSARRSQDVIIVPGGRRPSSARRATSRSPPSPSSPTSPPSTATAASASATVHAPPVLVGAGARHERQLPGERRQVPLRGAGAAERHLLGALGQDAAARALHRPRANDEQRHRLRPRGETARRR